MADQKKNSIMPSRNPSSPEFGQPGLLTTRDLEIILEVNQKALQINLEVEAQNEDIIEYLKESEETQSDIKDSLTLLNTNIKDLATSVTELRELEEENRDKISEIEKALFRCYLALSSTAIGIIITFIQMLIKK